MLSRKPETPLARETVPSNGLLSKTSKHFDFPESNNQSHHQTEHPHRPIGMDRTKPPDAPENNSQSEQPRPPHGPIGTGRPFRCDNGVDMRGRRQFWVYSDDEHPFLFDAFAKNGTLLLFFTVRADLCSRCKPTARVTSAAWSCLFRDGSEAQGTVEVNKAHGVHTIIVACGLPVPASLPTQNPSVGATASVSFKEAGAVAQGHTHHYHDVPFCRYPDPDDWGRAAFPGGGGGGSGGGGDGAQTGEQGSGRYPVGVAACTLLKSTLERYSKRDADLLLEWLAYHRLQGVGHFHVYAHEEVIA
jgi:hypothetical protein